MKKITVITLAIVLLITGLFIYRNATIIRGTDELIEKAQEVLPVSQTQLESISYVGLIGNDDDVLIWFISNNEYGSQDYWAINCKIAGRNAYMYVDWKRPIEYKKDIVSTLWEGNSVFLINDTDCVAIQYTDNEGKVVYEDKIQEGSYPYLYEERDFSGKIDFIDSTGKPLF